MKTFYQFYQKMKLEAMGQPQPPQPGQPPQLGQPGQPPQLGQPGQPQQAQPPVQAPIQGGQTSPAIPPNPLSDPNIAKAFQTISGIKDPKIQQAFQQFQKTAGLSPAQQPQNSVGQNPNQMQQGQPVQPVNPQAPQQPQR